MVMKKILETSRNLFLSRLIQAISTRFEGDLHLFKGCTVLSFNKWPSSLDEDTEFGDTLISELVDVCSPGLMTQLMLTQLNQSGQDLNVNCIPENVDAFDPTKAINLWSTEGVRSRRPFYKDNLKKSCTDDILIDVATSAEVEMEVNEDEEIETDNDYNLVQNVYLEAEKLEDEDDSIILKMTDQKNIFTFKDERPQQCPSLEYSTDFLQNKVPLVIDNGTYQCRAGWATSDKTTANIQEYNS
ncbi:ACTR5 [Mytilus edulis]|uniref:ACTR5 n=1 Tax=Mytilus edulis TaxID=6550 RepID=A0A8S3UUF2_MYTED|nr:ACTR5 [Mytilus edulis]